LIDIYHKMKYLSILLLGLIFGGTLYSQESYSLYLNYKKEFDFTYDNSLYQTDQIYFIECDDSLVYIHNHYIEISSYPNYCLFYFGDEFIGNYSTKRWINGRHMILYFIESKTYYYFYRSLDFQ
jgi:hypothetical protein